MLPFVLKNWKLVVIITAFLLISGLTYYVQILQDKLVQVKSDNRSLIQLYSDDHRDLAYYKTQHGQEVAQNKALQISHKAMQDLMESREYQWLSNFEGLKKSLKNLEIAQQITARVYDSVKVRLEQKPGWYVDQRGDTIKINLVKFEFQDKYAKIKARQITLDSAEVIYNINVPLQQVVYWDRKWFLGKKHYESEITSPNKSIAITKLETIFVKKQKK